MGGKKFLITIILGLAMPSFGQFLSQGFDENRALQNVQKQVEFGPRPAGSPELQKTRAWIEEALRSYGLEVQEQAFTQATPRGKIKFVNVSGNLPREGIAKFLPDHRKIILLASHYDTKWLPKIRFLGANDGASSTGVLLEIAREISMKKGSPPGTEIRFVFFDGEEAVENYGPHDGLFGSKYFVEQANKEKWLSRVRAMVLLDMVGSRELSLQIRPPADADLTRKIVEAAEKTDARNKVRIGEMGMIDDHAPFAAENIPVIDLIDFNYGTGNQWWHTAEDSLDKISPKSLGITGRIVLKMLEDWKN